MLAIELQQRVAGLWTDELLAIVGLTIFDRQALTPLSAESSEL